jgi:hypothetical protein
VEVKESEDVKPVKSGQDEQTAGALCIKNVVVEGVESPTRIIGIE